MAGSPGVGVTGCWGWTSFVVKVPRVETQGTGPTVHAFMPPAHTRAGVVLKTTEESGEL